MQHLLQAPCVLNYLPPRTRSFPAECSIRTPGTFLTEIRFSTAVQTSLNLNANPGSQLTLHDFDGPPNVDYAHSNLLPFRH